MITKNSKKMKSTIFLSTLFLSTLSSLSLNSYAAEYMTRYGQDYCYTVASFISPDILRCNRIGTNYLGKPIWTCCE